MVAEEFAAAAQGKADIAAAAQGEADIAAWAQFLRAVSYFGLQPPAIAPVRQPAPASRVRSAAARLHVRTRRSERQRCYNAILATSALVVSTTRVRIKNCSCFVGCWLLPLAPFFFVEIFVRLADTRTGAQGTGRGSGGVGLRRVYTPHTGKRRAIRQQFTHLPHLSRRRLTALRPPSAPAHPAAQARGRPPAAAAPPRPAMRLSRRAPRSPRRAASPQRPRRPWP